MMRGLPGGDAWLSPPDPKVPPSGDDIIYVERGDDEIEVRVWFDEGTVWKWQSKTIVVLTDDEKQRAEEDWAQREPDERDEDAYDRENDR